VSAGRPPALFAPGELAPWATPSRVRRRAALEPRRAEERRVMERLRGMASDLAGRFGLRYRAIDPERDGVNAHYGICYEDGSIRIRLRHARTRRLLKESSLVDTHLRHLDHSLRFRRLYARILDEARRAGYYRPGPEAAQRPRQLSLFRIADCGTRSRL
jgi:hypothetical protein